MKIIPNVYIKYWVFILLALLTSGATMVHGTAFAQEETFLNVGRIDVPGGLNSFDIGFVDPKIGRYFLADRTNSTVDEVKTSINSINQLAKGAFLGVQAGTNTSGPNGVITANNHTEVWAADGVLCGTPAKNNACTTSATPATQTSRILVIDLKTGEVTHTIDNGGNRRADELCEDPQHHVVLVANDDDSDLFLTFISTNTYEILGKPLSLDGTDPNAQNVKATNGIEQCQWSPRTGKFYLAVPEVNGSGSNTQPGAVLEIDPTSRMVEKVFSIDFGFLPQTGTPGMPGFTPATADCLGPQGLAIGPNREILLGCSNAGKGSVIINERNGDLVRSLAGLNGNDEVWYNPGNNHYFLAGSNHNLALPTLGPILGVVDQKPDTIDEDASPATAAGSHSVAADPVFNQVYVPGNNAATSICPGGHGCIAIFMSANHDPGICGGKANAFKSQVCPDKKGKPGTN
ncbi:MAG TPA: hypothetical protein VFF31_25755 [Blastocatellia bacterium]|jgi:hypothetical protein|nr:hypothetical protein [Blastocatellia bacterium]